MLHACPKNFIRRVPGANTCSKQLTKIFNLISRLFVYLTNPILHMIKITKTNLILILSRKVLKRGCISLRIIEPRPRLIVNPYHRALTCIVKCNTEYYAYCILYYDTYCAPSNIAQKLVVILYHQ